MTALLAGLMGVDLALGELTGTDALVGGTVLLEASVLWDMLEAGLRGDRMRRKWVAYQWACRCQTF